MAMVTSFPAMTQGGKGYPTQIANNELEKFRLNFSRCANLDVVSVILITAE